MNFKDDKKTSRISLKIFQDIEIQCYIKKVYFPIEEYIYLQHLICNYIYSNTS